MHIEKEIVCNTSRVEVMLLRNKSSCFAMYYFKLLNVLVSYQLSYAAVGLPVHARLLSCLNF